MSDYEANAYDLRIRNAIIGLGSDRDFGSLTTDIRYEIHWRSPDGRQGFDVGQCTTWELLSDVAARESIDLRKFFAAAGRVGEGLYDELLNTLGVQQALEMLSRVRVVLVDEFALARDHRGSGVGLRILRMLQRRNANAMVAIFAVPPPAIVPDPDDPDEEAVDEMLDAYHQTDLSARNVDKAGADRLRGYFAKAGLRRLGSSYFMISVPALGGRDLENATTEP